MSSHLLLRFSFLDVRSFSSFQLQLSLSLSLSVSISLRPSLFPASSLPRVRLHPGLERSIVFQPHVDLAPLNLVKSYRTSFHHGAGPWIRAKSPTDRVCPVNKTSTSTRRVISGRAQTVGHPFRTAFHAATLLRVLSSY